MPVKRFRDVSEMVGNNWHEAGDPRLFDAIRAVWESAAQTSRPSFPPGVYKHRSIEQANALQETWDSANFEAFHNRRNQERTQRS